MRYRPHLSDEEVGALLERHYRLGVSAVEFLPVGMDGWAYRVEDAHGQAWFAKLRQALQPGELPVTAYLRERLGLEWLVAARPTPDGLLAAQVSDLHLVVYPFVAGESLMDRGLRSGDAQRIGRMLAELHGATGSLPPDLRAMLPAESFRAHQETAARVLQAALASWPPGSAEAALAEFIRDKTAPIERVLLGARALGARARSRGPAQVVCHADIHGANILTGADGRLSVIDWDGIMLAPPERDLVFWRNAPEWPEIAAAYGLAGEPDGELIAYYGHEWVVQEVADFGENVFFLPLGEEQKADSLAEFRRLFEPGNVVSQALAE